MIREAIVILPVFVCSVLYARGESRPWKMDAIGNDEQQVLKLHQKWAEAELKHDAAALARILDDEFVASYASGKAMDKATFIAQAMKFSMASQTVSPDVVHIYGDTATIAGTTIIRSLNGAGPARSCRYTKVYLKRDGHWFGITEELGPGSAVDPASAGGAGPRRKELTSLRSLPNPDGSLLTEVPADICP